jgi:hypothetical protein
MGFSPLYLTKGYHPQENFLTNYLLCDVTYLLAKHLAAEAKDRF